MEAAMWIFAYGSLMADGWERVFGSTSRAVATLHDYERSFTKASTVNWGTKAYPAPTLRIIERAGAKCMGVAFEFLDERQDGVFEYLAAREGKGFTRIQVRLNLTSGDAVEAFTYRYEGRSVITTSDVTALAEMATLARGTSGTGAEYIRQTQEALAKEGLSDSTIDTIAEVMTETNST
jgi:cation transport protein ChaC